MKKCNIKVVTTTKTFNFRKIEITPEEEAGLLPIIQNFPKMTHIRVAGHYFNPAHIVSIKFKEV